MRKFIRIILIFAFLVSLYWISFDLKNFETWITALLISVSFFGTYIGETNQEKIENVGSEVLEQKENNKKIITLDQTKNDTEINLNELKIAFNSVKKMQYMDSMDESLLVIVKKAVMIDQFDFAMNVTKEGQYKNNIDEMLSIIVDACLAKKDFKRAEKASNMFQYSEAMDKAKRKIAESV